MQRNLRKEYSLLTKSNAHLFKFHTKRHFGFSSDRAFYDVVNGKRKIEDSDFIVLLKILQEYHNDQRICGKMHCVIEIPQSKV